MIYYFQIMFKFLFRQQSYGVLMMSRAR